MMRALNTEHRIARLPVAYGRVAELDRGEPLRLIAHDAAPGFRMRTTGAGYRDPVPWNDHRATRHTSPPCGVVVLPIILSFPLIKYKQNLSQPLSKSCAFPKLYR